MSKHGDDPEPKVMSPGVISPGVISPEIISPKIISPKIISPKIISKAQYEKELLKLQTELVRMQEWIIHEGVRLVVIFEGRDTAGKGGTIKRIAERLNSRYCRIVALGTPTERERSQWYFQRYVPHLPAAGEIVLFDRSWYNRAGVERVMGFCTDDEYNDFLRTCPMMERALVRSGIVVVKYWLSLSDEEQERRFTDRINNPGKRWKLSPMDLEARARWVDYAEAKDDMFAYTDIKEAPWHVVDADDKKSARLNVISHLLETVAHEPVLHPPIELPPRQERAYAAPAHRQPTVGADALHRGVTRGSRTVATKSSCAVAPGRAQCDGQGAGVGLVLAAGSHHLGQRRRRAAHRLVDGGGRDVVEREVVRAGGRGGHASPSGHRAERAARQHVGDVLLVVPRVPLGLTRRVGAEDVGEDVPGTRVGRLGLVAELPVGGEDLGRHRRVRRVHPTRGPEGRVAVDVRAACAPTSASSSSRMVTCVNPMPGIPGSGRAVSSNRVAAHGPVVRAERGEVDGVLPLVPRRLLGGADALGVDDEQPRGRQRLPRSTGAQLDGSTPPAAIHRLTVSCASAGE